MVEYMGYTRYVEWWVNGKLYGKDYVEVRKGDRVEARIVYTVKSIPNNLPSVTPAHMCFQVDNRQKVCWDTSQEGTFYVPIDWTETEEGPKKYAVVVYSQNIQDYYKSDSYVILASEMTPPGGGEGSGGGSGDTTTPPEPPTTTTIEIKPEDIIIPTVTGTMFALPGLFANNKSASIGGFMAGVGLGLMIDYLMKTGKLNWTFKFG